MGFWYTMEEKGEERRNAKWMRVDCQWLEFCE
jgi:hypothetical protein